MYCKYCGKECNNSDKFCKYCGQNLNQEITARKKRGWRSIVLKILLLVVIITVVIIFLLFYFGDNEHKNSYVSSYFLDELDISIQPVGYFNDPDIFDSVKIHDEEWISHIEYFEVEDITHNVDESKYQFPNQAEIFGSVVKVVCEDSNGFYRGSGTNFNSSGHVLTNLHVVDDVDGGCVVGFPDPVSGLIMEAYWATPIIDKDNITGHDLAYLSVGEPLIDDEYNVYGYYYKKSDSLFTSFNITEDCSNATTQLGDRLFVIGYPPIGGWALTITDGLVSSLYSKDGYIITSAKIVSGNSGGMAVDEQGCYVGVPTSIYHEDGDEYLGEVIDAEFVDEFDEAVADDIDEYINSL